MHIERIKKIKKYNAMTKNKFKEMDSVRLRNELAQIERMLNVVAFTKNNY